MDGIQWKLTPSKQALVTCVDSKQLETLKSRLATLGADPDAIDSVDHSIDYGDPFNITVEVEDPRQVSLL